MKAKASDMKAPEIKAKDAVRDADLALSAAPASAVATHTATASSIPPSSQPPVSEDVQQHIEQARLLLDSRESVATKAARLLSTVAAKEPQLLAGAADVVAQAMASKFSRVVTVAAEALPTLSRLAPARVAKHLDLLIQIYPEASETGKDGLVRAFAALCAASVAYQKRLENILSYALNEADGKALIRWTETVLPALKGEPHARIRAVVEARLNGVPRPVAQKLATFLGIKLRPSVRP